MMKMIWSQTPLPLCFFIIAIWILQVEATRDKRVFSLFSVVKFKNDPCPTSTDPNTRGTCLASSECASQGGSAEGNCAAGFGVCCVFVKNECGSTVNHNCTYIRNAAFPNSNSGTSSMCSYTLNRICDGLCQIRLDFNTLQLPLDSEDAGNCGNTGDSLNVRSPTSSHSAAFPPPVCGTLNGQHMYFETGSTGAAGTLDIVAGSGPGNRRYDIKVTYIECFNPNRPAFGCTQYFTGPTGTISSYNHAGGQMLQAQLYTNCIRQELGYCQTSFRESPVPNAFVLGDEALPTTLAACEGSTHVLIPSTVEFSTKTADGMIVDYIPSLRCGTVFGGLADSKLPTTIIFTEPSSLTSLKNFPFELRVNSRAEPQTDLIGFSLDYNQVPC